MKKATLAKFNGTLPAKMLAALCVLNCVGAVTPPAEESALETKSTAAAPSLKNCVALETKCKKKDLWEVTESCGVEEIEKKCMNLCKAKGKEALSKNCKKACCVLPPPLPPSPPPPSPPKDCSGLTDTANKKKCKKVSKCTNAKHLKKCKKTCCYVS